MTPPSRDKILDVLLEVVECVEAHTSGTLYEECSNVVQTYAGDYDCQGCSACNLQDAVDAARGILDMEHKEPQQDEVTKLKQLLQLAISRGLHRPTYPEGEGLGAIIGDQCHESCWCWPAREAISDSG